MPENKGTDTLGHISESVEHLKIPNLQSLGMANLHPLRQVASAQRPLGYFMRLNERSRGKDTMTGHWEMMGLKTEKPFITFTDTGFPCELIEELEKRTGRKRKRNRDTGGTGRGGDCQRPYDCLYLGRLCAADLRERGDL